MAVPPNTIPATATLITSLPYTITVVAADVQDAPGTHDLWWRYVGQPGEVVLGSLAFADTLSNYNPTLSIWVGTPDDLSLYLGLTTADIVPLLIPVVSGTTYYFKVHDPGGSEPLGADLVFKVAAAPDEAVPDGSLLVPADTFGHPGAIISATTGAILRYVNIPAGERGDRLPSGILALQTPGGASGNYTHGVRFYSSAFALLGEFSDITHDPAIHTTTGYHIRANPTTERFYFTQDVGTTMNVYALSPYGVVLQSWAVSIGSSTVAAVAVDRTDGILYWLTTTTINRYNLATGAAMAALSPVLDGSARDIIVLADNSLLVAELHQVQHFAADGTLLHTYDFTGINIDRVQRNGEDTSTSFVVWTQTSTLHTFAFLSVADGSELSSVTTPLFIDGIGQDPQTDATGPIFGAMNSCPLLVLAPVPDLPVPDPSIPCCETSCHCEGGGSGGGPSGGATGGAIPTGATGFLLPPVNPLVFTRECTGGGDVPSVADLTDAESWAA